MIGTNMIGLFSAKKLSLRKSVFLFFFTFENVYPAGGGEMIEMNSFVCVVLIRS
jgi:hypothetical protein